jgi:hypothetical protein
MRTSMRLVATTAVAVASLGVGGAVPAQAAPRPAFACSGTLSSPGVISAGTYSHVSMPAGTACVMPGPGAVKILSPLVLDQGAGLLVVGGSLSIDGGVTVGAMAAMAVPSNSTPVDIDGAVRVRSDGVFLLGTETPHGAIFASIDGPVRALDASSVQLHNTSVLGSVTLDGGGATNALVDAVAASMGASGPNNFNDLEDNKIFGRVVETHYDGVWSGILRDVIDGPMIFTHNSEAPNLDEYDIGSNRIDGPAVCSGNDPAPNLGHSAGSPSIVSGPIRGDQAATCTGVPNGVSGPAV